jgi:hypothetical protein
MQLSKIINGKKYMWDGATYSDKKNTLDIEQKYKNDGFETEILEEDKNYYIFTRKVVKEIIIEGQPTV